MIEHPPGASVTPRVSVVVATDRGGPYLAEALESIDRQTFREVETILVDDGSKAPDALRAITDQFPDVRVLRQQNAGVSVARNYGVSVSKGDLLVFLDDDDRWEPERLARQVTALDADPGAVLSYCGMRTIDADGHELLAADQRQVRDVHEVLRRTTGIILPNVMIRRETFLRIGGFHPSFRRAQDLDLVLKAALEGDFLFIDETLVDYRFHGANNTRRHRELCRSIDHVVRLHLWNARERGRDDLVPDYEASLAANDRFAAWSSARAARRLLAERRPGPALGELAWAARFAPGAPVSWVRQRLGRAGSRSTTD
ncbi:glycosyltransferase family 2 protein [Oerskovia merdavium]|uniref:Glycosyltransferase n=1 Tax=Oerskovia merdavium TaxID=2762227 RepID=A0ABR8TVC6_9CELL|nr:glycosyltransferase [Oerskovia merdavium]MBD7979425.1 glycosyltransferase [Oerskovia merdavium]